MLSGGLDKKMIELASMSLLIK